MKNAVVFAGGGARGSYEVGVWKALKELGYEFDIVTGTSVGALNAALMVQDDFEFACSLWDDIDTSKILDVTMPRENEKRSISYRTLFFEIFRKGGLEYTPLKNIIEKCLDEDKIRKSPMDFGIVTVEFPSFKPHILFKENIPSGQLKEYLLASSACFPAMKCHVIDGIQYIDGGYYDNMPIKMAMERGADNIIAIDLDGPGRSSIPKNDNVNINVISCPWPLGDVLYFDKNVSRKNMELGYFDAMKSFGHFEGVRYTFINGESESLINKNYDKFTSFLSDKFSITAGKPNSPLEEAARIKVARYLRKKWGKALDRMTTIIAAAEVAAEIFRISPATVYTFEDLNITLHKSLMEISKGRKTTAFKNLQFILDPRVRVLNLARMMNKKDLTENLRQFPGLATILPGDFIAATYISVMELI